MKTILIHRAFETIPKPICEIDFEDTMVDIDCLNQTYKATQNVEDSWTNNTQENHITLIGKDKNYRSTSIGDLAVINDESGAKFFQCCSTNWDRLDVSEFFRIMAIDDKKDLKDYIHDLYMEEEEGITLKGR